MQAGEVGAGDAIDLEKVARDQDLAAGERSGGGWGRRLSNSASELETAALASESAEVTAQVPAVISFGKGSVAPQAKSRKQLVWEALRPRRERFLNAIKRIAFRIVPLS
jgi:hypothetical protein